MNSKAALNSAVLGAASSGDTFTLGTQLVGDGAGNDVLSVPVGTSVTIDLNGHELDLDRVEVGDSSYLTLADSTGTGARLVVGSASAPAAGATGVVLSTSGTLEVGSDVQVTSVGSADRAGIGTIAGDDAAARLFINPGATVTATGGSHGAGIGGGAGAVPLRTISIGDATVVATGGAGAAGIGGGYGNPSGSNLIKIDNTPTGSVTATGGAGAAGIGGGQANGAGTGKGSNVTLSDADVTVADGGLASGAGPAPSAIGGGQGAASADFGTLNHTFSGTAGRRDALRIAAGATLTVPSGKVVTNKGTLVVRGTLAGSGAIDNTDGTIAKEGAGVITDAALSITGRNYAVTFDAAGGTTTAPATQHVYASSFASASLDLAAYTGSNGGRALTGWTANGVAVTNTDALAGLATANTVALTAAYAATATTGTTGGAGGTSGGGTAGTTPRWAAPVLPGLPSQTLKLGRPVSLSLAATSDYPVTYTAEWLPFGIALDRTTGLLYGAATTSGHYVATVTASSQAGSVAQRYAFVVPAATRVITGSLGAVTPTAGKSVAVTIRGLKVGERWTIAVDGKPVKTGVSKFGGSVKSSVKLAKKAKDTTHVIRVSSDRRLTDASEVAVHELTVTAISEKKALHLMKKGHTLTVRGLAAKERVTIRRGHTVIASGRADTKGVFAVTKKTLKHATYAVTGATKHRTDRLVIK